MTFEIVFPNNNEKEFVNIAEKLGIKKLMFIYNEKEFQSAETKFDKIETNIELEKGLFVANINTKIKSKFSAAKSSLNDRILIENKSADLIYGFEEVHHKDSTHQRNSNLNHIICQLAHDKDVSFGFSYSQLLNSDKRALIMGRMKQNIKLCKKYKVKMIFASFTKSPFELRSRHDASALFRILERK